MADIVQFDLNINQAEPVSLLIERQHDITLCISRTASIVNYIKRLLGFDLEL